MTRKANTGSRSRNSNRQRSVKARGSRTQKRTLTGGIPWGFGRKLNRNLASEMVGFTSKQQHQSTSAIKQLGLMSRTKKFFGGLKQKLSNKMSGVSKFILENREGKVNGQSNLHYFVLDENDTLYNKIYVLPNKDNISSDELSNVNIPLYNKLKGKGLLAQIVKTGDIYKFDNIIIDQKTTPGKVRIFTYYISKALHSPSQPPTATVHVPVIVKQNNNKGLGDENAILFTAKDSHGKDINFKYRKVGQSNINDIVKNIKLSLSDSERLCSWDDIRDVIANSNHEQKIKAIITKITYLQHTKELVYIYNDNGVIKYTNEDDTDMRQSFSNKSTLGKSNNQPVIESTILPTTVKYVVYAYKAGEGIYNTPLRNNKYEEAGYMTLGEMRAGRQPNKQEEANYLQVEPSGKPTSRQTNTKVNPAPKVISAPPSINARKARKARLAALAAARQSHYRLPPATNTGLQFNNPLPSTHTESTL